MLLVPSVAMKKRKRTRVRSPRASPTRPAKGFVPKALKGAPESRFSTKWSYLDTSQIERPDVGQSNTTVVRKGAGKGGKKSARTLPAAPCDPAAPARSTTYYEPPKSWRAKTDAEVLEWFAAQDDDYQRRVTANAETAAMSLVFYLRKMSAPMCGACGFDGSPRSLHSYAYPCMRWREMNPELPDDDEDDLPF